MTTDQDTLLADLRGAADDLAREMARLPESATLWKPSDHDWSQHEVLTHLWIAEHFIFLPRLQAIAAHDQPRLPLVDEVAYQKEKWNPATPRADLLAAFQADRAAEIELLGALAWDKTGTHPSRGPISAGWIAQYALGHTWEHLSQMLRVRLSYVLRAAPPA
ncbi:MAG: DinB family protein [Anaerolineales bacterium]|nr:DinB family protein [Anaerolineales bacterium]